MRPFLTLLALLLAALAPAGRAGAAPARPSCPGCVAAGAAVVPLRVPPGTPLAGYGSLARRLLVPDVLDRHPHAFWLRPGEGVLDPVSARALVVEAAGQRLVWVSADLIAVDGPFTALVARGLARAGLGGGALVISASHTHSGPGAFVRSGLLGAVSVDREDTVVRDALVESVVEAVGRAEAAKTRARLGSGSAAGPALTTGRLDAPVDREIVVLKVVSEAGAPLAVLWNYAIHGTMLGPRNRRLSGDVMGLASLELERRLGVPALYVNGAVGDVSPERHGDGEARAAAAELAGAVAALWDRVRADAPAVLRVERARVNLPAPGLSVRSCVGRWVPRVLRVPLGSVLPDEAELVGGVLGTLAWVTMPGELQSRLGERIKREARAGWPQALVAGLSNGYLGYFLAPEAYGRPSYVACASLYGPTAGERLVGAAVDLVGRLRRGGR